MSTPSPAQPDPPEQEPRRTGALIWILLLIVLIALGWYLYARRGTTDVPPEPVPIGEPTPAEIGDGSAPPPAREREPAAAPAPAEPPPAPEPAETRPAQPLEQLQPSYPPAAFRAREEGTVVLLVTVSAQGEPIQIDVAHSSRSRELDRAARDAVRKWRFSPALQGGRAVESAVEIPVDFKLDQETP